MKKIYLLVVAFALVFSSCSNDDDRRDSSILKVTVDGILRTYTNVTVEQENQTINENVISVLKIKAASANQSNDYIEFGINEGELGATPIVHYFNFVTQGQTYVANNQLPGQFSVVINENGNRILKGAFDGRVLKETDQKNITGSFNIYF